MTQGLRGRSILLIGLCLAFTAIFSVLGAWQIQRRAWKLDLIAQVEQRIHATPVPAPGPALWAGLSKEADAYRRVRLSGAYDHDREVLTQAVTDLGPGFWVMTPLRTEQGFTVLVNRGFVPTALKTPAARAAGQRPGSVTVVGLLRLSEPGGGFLRTNRPSEGRWYSRDVQAIGQAERIATLAPYFVDADATSNPGGWPRGGLTVVRFPNSHLIYALTWFGLAVLTSGAAAYVVIDARRTQRKEDE
ncbi:SURF1 family protein [Caulobacter sp. BP25]|uniref:SURF1 family protein n=1 Tax=Caulobacter sp. BP25 TaxID=2048900 RepID=UPI000C12D51F|nr:SURF1 family protein [Caulobacter sp. BP25]PHY21127.1 Surfeit locus 1 family protein [Caulobacter sp. BP25]